MADEEIQYYSKEEIEAAVSWGKADELRAAGYGDDVDAFLEAFGADKPWNPHDMSRTPPTPNHSQLDEQGRRYTIPDSVELPAGSEAPDYESWKRADLVAELKRRELPTTGKVEDLALRLMEDDEATVAPYEEWSHEELVAECKERGMPTGEDAEMVERLNKYDAELAKQADQ